MTGTRIDDAPPIAMGPNGGANEVEPGSPP
jgi:hypothetical protein